MTAVTRDAIVEAAARAKYMDDRTRGGEGPFEWPEWEDLPDFEQAICRESALVTVDATLTALMPLVIDSQEWGEANKKLGRHNEAKGEKVSALTAYLESHARFAEAGRLLAVIKP